MTPLRPPKGSALPTHGRGRLLAALRSAACARVSARGAHRAAADAWSLIPFVSVPVVVHSFDVLACPSCHCVYALAGEGVPMPTTRAGRRIKILDVLDADTA